MLMIPNSLATDEKILALARTHGLLRPRDLTPYGIAWQQLGRLHRAGKLERVARGVYSIPNRPISEHHSLALAIKQAPRGTICLLSVLWFHGLTTQPPNEVWLAMANNAVKPQISAPAIRVHRFSGPSLTEGREHRRIEGVDVPLYNVAKTIADCFKFRNKIGVDIAIGALRTGLQSKRATPENVYRYAQICRVGEVIRPYLEAMV